MSNCTDMPYEQSRPLLVAVYSVVFIVGLPTNCLTAIVAFVQIGRKNVTAIYLFGLSLCELMYLGTVPFWIVYVQNDHKWTMGKMACRVTGYIFFCNIYISILLLCCISADRYVAVVHALESRGKRCRCQRTAAAVTVLLFGTVAVIYCPVFFMQSIQDPASATCFEAQLDLQVAYYNIIRFFVGFIVPFALLIFMNYKIFQGIQSSCSLDPPQKAKVKNLAIAVISIFMICFAPYHCVLLVRSVFFLRYPKDTCEFERSIYTTSVVFLCLSTANGVADPFVYVLASENARREIGRTFRACGILPFSAGSKVESSKGNNESSQRLPRETHTTAGNEGAR